uniref:Uncharacterized protein n=1 Tax=Oryza barthii TaxID=65489 RepID=A0A0D3HHX6_9ORYZ
MAANWAEAAILEPAEDARKLWKQGVVLSKSLSLKSFKHKAHVSSLASAALVGTRPMRRSSDTVPARRARLHGGSGG